MMSRHFGKLPIDHYKLASYMIENETKILRAYYYDCKPYTSSPPAQTEVDKQSSFDKFIRKIEMLPHFECRFGRLEKRQCPDGTYEYVQKRVDVMMAIDIVNLSSKRLITHASIMSGDSDLIPAIQMAKNDGVVSHLFCFDGSTHYDLMQLCDRVTILNKETLLKHCCRP